VPSVRPVGPARFQVHAVGKDHPDLYYWRVELYDLRGGLRQEGRVDEDHARASLTDMVCDDQGILRLPFDTRAVTTTPSPSSTQTSHAGSAQFLGRTIMHFTETGTQRLWASSSTTDPTPTPIAGFTIPVNTLYLRCAESITINAIPYLALGYIGIGGLTFQVLSNLNNPPTSQGLAGETSTIDGIVQTPIDNDAVLYMAGGTIKAFGTNIGVGAVTVENRQTGFPQGGYCAGLITLGGGQTQVAWVVPVNGSGTDFQSESATDAHCKVVLTDLRGWNPNELKFPLKWIRFFTVLRDGGMACDGESHYYHTGRSIIAVDKASDWPANSGVKRDCRGHFVKGDKFVWEVNEIATNLSAATTSRYFMEYDLYLNTSRQISQKVSLSPATSVQTVGGARLPADPMTDYVTVFSKTGTWYQQYVPPANIMGYAARKTAGASVLTGQLYEDTGSFTWGPQEIPGLEGARKIVARITAPTQESLLTGGAGTRLVVTAGGKTATFDTQTPEGMHPYTDFENNGNWFERLEVSAACSRSTTATDAERLTGNYFPIVIEGFAVKRSLKVPPNWRGGQL
jgi:hypothetical protein